MTNRRVDALYFLLIVVVGTIGFVAANRPVEQVEGLALPDFSPLRFDIPFEPFELPFPIVSFENPITRRLALSSNMESTLVEVRTALLESSKPVEVRPPARMLAAID